MKQEFIVWTNKTRPPSTADITSALAAAGFSCHVQVPQGGEQDLSQWTSIRLDGSAEGELTSCLVTAVTPSSENIRQMAEDYENLPFQVKNAARKYIITADSDEYGQPTLFQLRVVATITALTHGVVEDPQESGLMLLDEFEDFIAST
ncbi:MAG: hypothetical protein HY314_16320 [Acidobacteria bacterium]|nr:hypothetical protein [Acidobacteriota bacterium]